MNHYERLKVSQDAPAEVIRAAYRTLAAKLHPDRQHAGEDAAHNEMAALNAAYEVLIDPKSRREYDATLLAPSPLAGGAFAPPQSTFGAASTSDASGAASTRVDLNWSPPGVASTAQPLWPPTRRMKLIGGSVLAVIILATAGVSWQFMGQRKMEQAMSRQYASQPAAASVSGDPALELPPQVADLGAAAKAPAGARRPSVDELARMSDEELLEILPTLDADSPVPPAVASRLGRSGNKATASSRGRHPLDGAPLNLRTESQLVDPLAPEVPPASAMRR